VTEAALFRVAVPVDDIARAIDFYSRVLGHGGESVGPGRHYFRCGQAIFVCFDTEAEGHGMEAEPGDARVFFAVDDLDDRFEAARAAGCSWIDDAPEERGWGERSFYARDPSGNAICFVDAATLYTGTAARDR
jgi:catechol 2,3-dioxygenase-like lactoylglutathione lyase family enzyme